MEAIDDIPDMAEGDADVGGIFARMEMIAAATMPPIPFEKQRNPLRSKTKSDTDDRNIGSEDTAEDEQESSTEYDTSMEDGMSPLELDCDMGDATFSTS